MKHGPVHLAPPAGHISTVKYRNINQLDDVLLKKLVPLRIICKGFHSGHVFPMCAKLQFMIKDVIYPSASAVRRIQCHPGKILVIQVRR